MIDGIGLVATATGFGCAAHVSAANVSKTAHTKQKTVADEPNPTLTRLISSLSAQALQ
jgi:hypothetical protein